MAQAIVNAASVVKHIFQTVIKPKAYNGKKIARPADVEYFQNSKVLDLATAKKYAKLEANELTATEEATVLLEDLTAFKAELEQHGFVIAGGTDIQLSADAESGKTFMNGRLFVREKKSAEEGTAETLAFMSAK